MSHPVTPGTIRHGKCGKTWTGLGRAHCPSCCETFSCESAADKHRVGKFGIDRRCVDPASVGLVANDRPWGRMWSHAAPSNGFDHRQLRDADDFVEPPVFDDHLI